MRYILLVLIAIFIACSTEQQSVDPKATLTQAVTDTKNLIKNSPVGNGEGQYQLKAVTDLTAVLKKAQLLLNRDHATDAELDEAVKMLYDGCMTFETGYNSKLKHTLVDSQVTKETRYLYDNLMKQSGNGLMFGAHDPTGYGVGWRDDNDRSDVKDVSGSYPAVFSWDYLTYFKNPDNADDFAYRIKLGYKNNAVTTICWHQTDPVNKSFYKKNIDYNVVEDLIPGGDLHTLYKEKLQKIADLAKSIRTEKGNSIPVIFRPYHEHNGDWFWWGKGNCSEEQFLSIWQFTVTYLRDSLNVHNFLYCFSPDGGQFEGKEEYMWNYPGDAYVDLMGLDFYFRNEGDEEKERFQARVRETVENALERNKIAAVTETGNEKIEFENFFTQYLLQPIMSDDLARKAVFAVVWRNDNPDHHYAPYPGHPSVTDFKNFYADSSTILASDMENFHELK